MTDNEVQMLVEEAYRQFAFMVIASTGAAGSSPKTEAIITKTLIDLHTRLRSDPAYLQELMRRARGAEKQAAPES